MTLRRFAELCSQALQHRRTAARQFLAESCPSTTELVMSVTKWAMEEVEAFERQRKFFMIRGEWGTFWMASSLVEDRDLVPPYPRVSPKGLLSLALGVRALKEN